MKEREREIKKTNKKKTGIYYYYIKNFCFLKLLCIVNELME